MDKSDSQGRGWQKQRKSKIHAGPVLSPELKRLVQRPPRLKTSSRAALQFSKSSSLLRRYMPMATAVLAVSFLLLALHPWPPVEIFLICIAFLASAWGLGVALSLFQVHPKYGAWPANRVAALVIVAVIADYWLWIFGGTYDSVSAYFYMGVNLAFFVLIMWALFYYFYRGIHIGSVIKLLLLKAIFDAGAFVVSGGLGIGLFNRLGIIHPLRVKTNLALTVSLEVTIVLIYLFLYRRRIAPPQN